VPPADAGGHPNIVLEGCGVTGENQSGAELRGPDATAPAPDDPDSMRTVFREAFERTSGLLDDPKIDDREALTAAIRRRNKVLDETADAYAKAGGAECKAGCVSCCHLMVMGAPFEILSIAQHLLETKTPAAIEDIKARLQKVSEIPLDPLSRVKAKVPCGLLEDGRCGAYEQRPSVCRMTLSQSRAACDSCLRDAAGSIPYIEQPSRVAAVMQAGIDHALITRRNLSIEGAELSRALLIALRDHEGAMTSWLAGRDPFPGAHFSAAGARSDRERAIAAAARFGAV
jgi:Fe-S-cluster containining protein